MSLPVGHSLAGLTIWTLAQPKGALRPKWREGLLVCLLANTPDFDFSVVWFLGWPIDVHRGPTHSLGFSLLLGTGVALARRWWGWTSTLWRDALLWSTVIFSHVLLDFIAYDTTPPNRGMMVFWPLVTGRWLSPWTIYPIQFMDKNGWALVSGVSVILAFELVVFGAFWWLALLSRALLVRAAEAPVAVDTERL